MYHKDPGKANIHNDLKLDIKDWSLISPVVVEDIILLLPSFDGNDLIELALPALTKYSGYERDISLTTFDLKYKIHIIINNCKQAILPNTLTF